VTNSKAKGSAGERELSRFIFETFGVSARRSQQYKGTADSADLETGFEGIHFECKRVEKLNIHDAMRQATLDCGAAVPCVAHRRNRTDWLFTIRAKDLLAFVQKVNETMAKGESIG